MCPIKDPFQTSDTLETAKGVWLTSRLKGEGENDNCNHKNHIFHSWISQSRLKTGLKLRKIFHVGLDISSDSNGTETRRWNYQSALVSSILLSFTPPSPPWAGADLKSRPFPWRCSRRVSSCVLTLRLNGVQQSLAEMKGRQVWKALWSVNAEAKWLVGLSCQFWSHLCHLQMQKGKKKSLCKWRGFDISARI